MNDKGFTLFAHQRAMLAAMTDEQAGQLLRALYAYNDGEEPEISDPVVIVAFCGIKTDIDRAKEKSEKMRQNRLGKTNDNKQEQNGTKITNDNKTKQNGTTFFAPKEKESIKEKENSGRIQEENITPLPLRGDPQGGKSPAKKAKHAYGEFRKVMLTDEEYSKLCEHFGGAVNAGKWIDRLDGHLASKGDPYKSHYATILTWERRDKERHTASTVPRQGYLSEAERRQMHNDEVCRRVSAELEAMDSPF